MYKRIVVGVANTERSLEVARRARELASTFGARLDIVTAYKGTGNALAAEDRRHAEGLVNRLAHPEPAGGVRTHALPGDPSAAILQVAEEIDADLIVVGNKGMRGKQRILGSIPNTVAHKALCSVLIVNSAESETGEAG
jgi:nucleotide-binding universal stress UspA family protein